MQRCRQLGCGLLWLALAGCAGEAGPPDPLPLPTKADQTDSFQQLECSRCGRWGAGEKDTQTLRGDFGEQRTAVVFELLLPDFFNAPYTARVVTATDGQVFVWAGDSWRRAFENPIVFHSENGTRSWFAITPGTHYWLEVTWISRVCFAAGTKIAVPGGFRNIEDIRVHDQVYSYDLGSTQVVLGEVTRTQTTPDRPVLEVRLSDGTKLLVTAEHPFYRVRFPNSPGLTLASDRQGEYVEAGQLQPGDVLLKLSPQKCGRAPTGSHALGEIAVRKVTPKPRAAVYNFSVKNYVDYFAEGVLVHNY